MSSFKFNFSDSDNPEEQITEKPAIEWVESEEIKPTFQAKNLDEMVKHAIMYTNGDVEIGHVVPSEVITCARLESAENGLQLAEKNHSDLIPGTYEGGLKIWEAADDLITYFVQNFNQELWDKARVLDLGCGAGLLGLLAHNNGSEVVFQDYNKEVLEYVTIPNVLLNIEEEKREDEMKRCKFYSGDWESFNKLLGEDKFDYILTSETIYNPDNYTKIINIISERLNENGIAFVAAKTYYFGVGGGMRDFESHVLKNKLKAEVCWKSKDGIQREILKITKLL